jgi:uncharacterized protein YdbL (DUF1318 family)
MKPWVVMLAAIVLAAPASAQTTALNAARQAGMIGARFDGYMGYAGAPSAMLRSQVETINIRRRALYHDLAARKGVSPQEVGITAGCQLLARVGVGQAYMLTDGAWRRRAAGQAAPQPAYCR